MFGALIIVLVGRWHGHSWGDWRATLAIRPGTILKVWVLQPEYYASGFHYLDRTEAVGCILGTTWWWHTVGLFNSKYEVHYQHAEKYFYRRRQLLAICRRWYVSGCSLGSCRQAARQQERNRVVCPTCQSALQTNLIPGASGAPFMQILRCRFCSGHLFMPGQAERVWFCFFKGCHNKFHFCNFCVHQITSGDMLEMYERLRAIEAIPDTRAETGTPPVDAFLLQPYGMTATQVAEDPAVSMADVPVNLASLEEPQVDVLPETDGESRKQPKSLKRIKQKRRRRVSKDEPAAIEVSP